VVAHGYQLAVAGENWHPRSRVTFAVKQGYRVTGLEVRANGDGTFEVGVKHIFLCNGEVFRARDFFDHEVQISGPPLMCPGRANPPLPTLAILKGSKPQMDVVPLISPAHHTPVVIKQGDAIYYWSPGNRHPGMVPGAPHHFFSLIDQGQTPPMACPSVKCGGGFLWEWVGVKAGDTGVALSPWCGPSREKACPQVVVLIQVRTTSRLEP
jgi:hypothetical protein